MADSVNLHEATDWASPIDFEEGVKRICKTREELHRHRELGPLVSEIRPVEVLVVRYYPT